jgi:3-keto-disaccharide hydrolase
VKIVLTLTAALALLNVTLGSTAGTQNAAAPSVQGTKPSAWQPLLEEGTANAWRGWTSQDLPAGWHVAKGTISKDGKVDDLVTREAFGNFELELEWKIGKAGNSGVFYRGTREYDHIYWSAPEYQLLDDANAEDGRSRLTAAASAYAVYPAPAGVVRPYGQWNSTRIVLNGPHVEHWLNGKKVVDYELWSPDWKARVAASKFVAYPNYGLAHRGHIGIQGDHPGTLSIRRVRIRELP